MKHIRQSNTVPVLLLTARDTEADMLQGFDAGCDDYVTKPFSMAVLLRRIEVLLKRAENTDSRFYYSGALAYDFDGKQLRKNGQEVNMTCHGIRSSGSLSGSPESGAHKRTAAGYGVGYL